MLKNKTKLFNIWKDRKFYPLRSTFLSFFSRNLFSIKYVPIFQLNLDEYSPEEEKVQDIEVCEANYKDYEIVLHEPFTVSQFWYEYRINRLRAGDKCIIIKHKGSIVGNIWIMNGMMEITPRKIIKVEDNVSYIYGAFILNEFRGRRILAASDSYIYSLLKSCGQKSVVTVIESQNKSSIKCALRVGFKIIGKFIEIKIKKKEIIYLSSELEYSLKGKNMVPKLEEA